ncbi:Dps family protein [Sphingomonas sp. PR090111-T3T-6A]|uniref:Dps family protein n=1 Tax=Sphingomonas sp. PR090111-T3T-6A TaxID=685778 RepID=UPI00047695D0|nr:DNA starvation/stationary phase protection protein [Sphingomonas sp. PR090111-T3T-6A]
MTTASPEQLNTPSDLGTEATVALADRLNATLADSFALYLKTKNFHWHVSGPNFRDYHLLFDEQAGQILLSTDAIAERVRKIGKTTVRSISDIARRQTLPENNAGFVGARDMLAELANDNLHLVQSLRAAKAVADEARDNATSGLIDAWTDEAEQRAWFLFETGRHG